MTAAVEKAFGDSHEKIEHQRLQMESSLNSATSVDLKPRIHLHFGSAGIEVTVRFPVELDSASEIDERIMRELLSAVEKEPKLKLVGSEMPTVKAG